jgi:probable HAF family extracellular repeat protein
MVASEGLGRGGKAMTIRSITRMPVCATLLAAAFAAAQAAPALRYHVQCQDCDLQQSDVSWWDLSINQSGLMGGQTGGHAVLYQHGVRTDLGTLGGSTSEAVEVGDSGAAVGDSTLANGDIHAFYWQDGQMRDLGLLPGAGFDYAGATGINDLGQIVGFSAYGASATHCFLTTITPGAALQDVGLPPDVPATWNCDAPKLNNRGHMTLVIGDETWYSRHGYLLRDGQWTALGSLDAANPNSFAEDVNDLDQVVGWSSSSAFLWSNGVLQDLGVLPGGTDGAGATAINNRGHVVGTSSSAGFRHHYMAGFLYRDGRMIDLNETLDHASRHWYIERAVDINDDDEIVGVGYLHGQPHTVLLKKR